MPPKPPLRTVAYNGQDYEVVKEGLAEILNLHPPPATGTDSQSEGAQKRIQAQEVFYNPIQQFNRDLSVLAIRVFAEELEAVRRCGGDKNAKKEERKKGRKKALEGAEENGDNGSKRKREGEDGVQEERPQKMIKEGGSDLEVPGEGAQEDWLGRTGVDTDKKETDAAGTSTENGVTEVERSQTAAHGNSADTERLPAVEKTKRQGGSTLDDAPKAPRASVSPIKILDALSASGLRALRYAKEIPQPTSITAVDLSPTATASIKLNAHHNDLTSQIHPITGNCLSHMYHVANTPSSLLPDYCQQKYHIIDLDPYGTAAPFIDAAVQAVRDNGLLLVTCTDSAIFASCGYLEKTFSQYGGLPLKGPQSHEGGLRLLLHTVATSAARYGIAIEPLVSLSIDFYIRVFLRVRRAPSEVKLLAGKTMTVYNCDSGCGSWTTQAIGRTQTRTNKLNEPTFKFSLGQGPTAEPNCSHCGFKTHIAGPMWGGPLHNPFFVQRMLDHLPHLDPEVYGTIPRMEGMLTLARDETLLCTSDMPPSVEPVPIPNSLTSSPPSSASVSLDIRKASSIPPLVASIPRVPPHLLDLHPFFILPSSLAKALHCTSPSTAAVRSALMALGYRCTRSHTKPGSIRTDAPWDVVWEVMREWVRQKAPVKEAVWKEGTVGWGLMKRSVVGKEGSGRAVVRRSSETNEGGRAEEESVHDRILEILRQDFAKRKMEPTAQNIEQELKRILLGEQAIRESDVAPNSQTQMNNTRDGNEKNAEEPQESERLGLKVVFNEDLGRKAEAAEGKKMVRYQINPRANWGPMTRAKET